VTKTVSRRFKRTARRHLKGSKKPQATGVLLCGSGHGGGHLQLCACAATLQKKRLVQARSTADYVDFCTYAAHLLLSRVLFWALTKTVSRAFKRTARKNLKGKEATGHRRASVRERIQACLPKRPGRFHPEASAHSGVLIRQPQRWPIPSPSQKPLTLLLEREGVSVLFFNQHCLLSVFHVQPKQPGVNAQ